MTDMERYSVDTTSPSNTKSLNNKEKLREIMEAAAASALTSLGDDESAFGGEEARANSGEAKEAMKQSTDEGEGSATPSKRFLPEHKKPDAAPTFPEKLMQMMHYAAKQDEEKFCVAWLEGGKSFVIRNPDEFTRIVVPQFFKRTKFSSFTRKLYRWGFRQINRGIGPDDPIIFGNEFFQRNNEHLMAKMRSVTAAGTRKVEESRQVMFGGLKRPGDEMPEDHTQKRMLIDHLMLQQSSSAPSDKVPFYTGMCTNGSLSLTSVIRSGMQRNMTMNMGQPPQMMTINMGGANPPGIIGMKPFDSINQSSPQASSIMNQFIPNAALNQQQFASSQSTADIVNAAIAALRFAN